MTAKKKQPQKEKQADLKAEVDAQLDALKAGDEDTTELGFETLAALVEQRDETSAADRSEPVSTTPKRIVTNDQGEAIDPEKHALEAKIARMQAEMNALRSGSPAAPSSSFSNQKQGQRMGSEISNMMRVMPLTSVKHNINRKYYNCKKGVPTMVPEYLAKRMVNADPPEAKLI